WIKAEIFKDLHLTDTQKIHEEIEKYIQFFNEERPAYSLNYLTPKQYRKYCLAKQMVTS
ncbi:MAG: IS3 family transposase, partial [Firmicutes bacterium]|nr:IS3 family transposase [Bacillota bacterium]